MSEVCCKRCGATDHVKNGIVRGFQRYLCLSCGCNFTMTPPRGRPPAMKALALLLCAMGNVSFGSIARISGSATLVDLPLRIYHHFHDNLEKAAVFRAIFR
jgi:transposase-like protein